MCKTIFILIFILIVIGCEGKDPYQKGNSLKYGPEWEPRTLTCKKSGKSFFFSLGYYSNPTPTEHDELCECLVEKMPGEKNIFSEISPAIRICIKGK